MDNAGTYDLYVAQISAPKTQTLVTPITGLGRPAPQRRFGLHWSYQGITATIDGKVVGVIVWIDQKAESKRLWLQLGYVVPEFRGKGIYSHLWASLVEKARELGVAKIASATRMDNYQMRAVAKKQGRIETAVHLSFKVSPREGAS